MNAPAKSESLQPGDLAIVIREHCITEPLGKIVTIGGRMPPTTCMCFKCYGSIDLPIVNVIDRQGDGFWPIAWLRKLPPVSEFEGEKNDEEITA